MPPALAKAHADLDRAVDRCYRPKPFASDRERVEHLFALYEHLTAPSLPPPPPRRNPNAPANRRADQVPASAHPGLALAPGPRDFSLMVSDRKLSELIVYLGRHSEVGNLGLTKLWKLIFFIDARALRDLGEPVTGSEFIKYEHGPVPSRGDKFLRKLLKTGEVTSNQRTVGGKLLNEIKAVRPADLTAFSFEERQLIDSVCVELGRKSAAVLSELSHKEPSWHYARMMDKLSPELIAYGRTEDTAGL